MDKNIAIRVEHVSKTFKIPHEKVSSLRGAAVSAFRNKSYEEFKALDDVFFEVKKGEFFGIIGRNGSGKSTLLKILAGIYQSDKGKVHVNGRISPFLELGIGFNPELSGRDNVYLNATVLGLTKKEIDEKFDAIVKFSELERFIDQKLKNYSSGMQVRLAFSVSIHANREILLMDEVLAVGDSNFQRKCINEFEKYKQKGKTVILVTHDMKTVEEYCDRAMLINNGDVVSIGDPKTVSLKYQDINMSSENKRLKEELDVKISKKYGNNKAIIYDCKIFNQNGLETRVLESGEKFSVKLYVDFNADLKDISFNCTLKDNFRDSRLVFHSLYSRSPMIISEVKKGKKIEIVFSGEMLLAPGDYSMYADICENVKYPKYELVYADENTTSINVFSNKVISGPINYNHSTEINNIN